MGKKYLITWNAGWGQNEDIIEADSLEEAQTAAYEACREEFESAADYSAKELTPEVAEEHGIELEEADD
jgi:hypothetical protein